MTENHPISNGFIPETARVLVIGTFPPKSSPLGELSIIDH